MGEYYFTPEFNTEKNKRLWDSYGFSKIRKTGDGMSIEPYKVVGVTIDGFLVVSHKTRQCLRLSEIPNDWYVKEACRDDKMYYSIYV